jgi:SAM-dependent methyltransferase
MDLHTRSRYRYLSRFLSSGPIDTLDAGFGNGALSYAAYRKGNRVLAVSNDVPEVEKAGEFYSWLRTDPERLKFLLYNLYDLPALNLTFDQIICSETLEHIRQDEKMLRFFYQALRPGGVLHLSCPNSLHPLHPFVPPDKSEDDGAHVRSGYTIEDLRKMVREAGFVPGLSVGLGIPVIARLDQILRKINHKIGNGGVLPLFLLTLPLQIFDRLNPPLPFSIYLQATKPKANK